MKSSLSPSPKSSSHSRPKIDVTWIILGLMVGFLLWKIIHSDKAEMTTISAGDTVSMSRKRSLSAQEEQRKRKMRAEADPVSTYLDRAKRGMTDQEILSMIEDFEAMGSNPTSGDISELADFGEKQSRWYSIAIEEALSLNTQQQSMLHDSLADNVSQRIELFKKTYIVPSPMLTADQVAQINSVEIFTLKHATFAHNYYASNESLAPWKLCNLSYEQLKLTYHGLPIKRIDSDEDMVSWFSVQQMNKPWSFTQSLIMLEPSTGMHFCYPPTSLHGYTCKVFGSTDGLIDISPLFPVTPDQRLADHRDDFVAQARMLHPAQLRMALIRYPHIAQTLKEGLARAK